MNISEIVGRINESTKLLSSGIISEIDRDILLADLRDLYLIAKGHTPAVKAATEQSRIEEVKMDEVREIIAPVVEKIEPVIAPVITPEAVIIPEPVVQVVAPPVPEVKKEIPPASPVEKEEPVQLEIKRIHYHEGSPVRGPKINSLNEVFVGEEKSLNSAMGGEKKRALNDIVPGKDLNTMLDLNKKHVLTNELFGGDSKAFQAAISYINSSPNIETAFDYIKTQLLPVYQWKGDQQSTKLFDKLVRQKFGV